MEALLLDTNVLSELTRPQPDQAVMDWFAERTGAIFYVTSITQAEIMLGISLLPDGKRRETLAAAAEGMFSQDFAGKYVSGYSGEFQAQNWSGLAFRTTDVYFHPTV